MESRFSSNCSRDIHRCSTPGKKVSRKKNRGKDCLKATDSKINACSDIGIGEVLFHYVTFCDKENRDLSSKIYLVSFDGIF